MIVLGSPSSSLRNGTFFKATISPVSMNFALITTPWAPSPICFVYYLMGSLMNQLLSLRICRT